MYKKLFAALIVATFLIISIGVISAADDSISIPVKVAWDGDSADVVKVNLLKDGVVVDTAKLNAGNSWKTTFKVDDDGNYKVSVVDSDKYTSSVKGDAKNGFTITAKLVEKDTQSPAEDTSQDDNSSGNPDVLTAVDDASQAEDTSNDNNGSGNSDVLAADDNPFLSDDTQNDNNPSDNQQTGNTNGATAAENNNSSGNSSDNSTDNNSTNKKDDSKPKDNSDKATKVTKTKTTTTTKVVKQDDKKKPENTTKTKKHGTGFPIIVLVVALIAVVGVSIFRKK